MFQVAPNPHSSHLPQTILPLPRSCKNPRAAFLCSLTSVKVLSLSQLMEVSSNFLEGCRSLTSFDLSPLTNVTHIGGSFLSGCCSLKVIDLSTLALLREVPSDITFNCRGSDTDVIIPPTYTVGIMPSLLARKVGVGNNELAACRMSPLLLQRYRSGPLRPRRLPREMWLDQNCNREIQCSPTCSCCHG
jgi:hypothetical protein